MRPAHFALVLLLLCRWPAWGVPDVDFRVQPKGATLWDVDTKQHIAPVEQGTNDEHYRFATDPSQLHHYSIERPHCDQQNLLVRLEGTHWRYFEDGKWQDLSYIYLAATIALHVEPSPFHAFLPNDRLTGTPNDGQGLEVDGHTLRVVPLPVSGNQVTVPRAYAPPPFYVVADGYLPYQVIIAPGSLDQPAVPDIRLVPRPETERKRLGVILGFLVLVGAALWWVKGRHWLRRAQQSQALVTQLRQSRDARVAALSPARMREQVVTSESRRRYHLLELLGQGGMGAVYRALPLDLADDPSPVAVKVLTSDDVDNRRRFAQEIRICQSLSHPAIVKVLDWGEWQANEETTGMFLVMELLSGRTVHQVAKEFAGPVPPGLVIDWMVDALQALRSAHAAGIVHRDVKPDNLMVMPGGRIKLLDFGVARDTRADRSTQTGAMIGTPIYMSPEHFNAKHVTAASDIYSLGMVAYELLAARLPFEGPVGDSFAMLARLLTTEMTPLGDANPTVPPDLASVVMQMLSKDPLVRGDAQPLIARLQAVRQRLA